MTKTGIVTQINKNKVFLMTSGGEFVKVSARGKTPAVGQVYTGELYVERPFYRAPLLAASVLLCILVSGGFYSYYTPVAAVTIDINPSVKLELNRWNKIIKTLPLNEDGKKVLEGVKLSNKSVEEGLNLIVEQAKKDNFINAEYQAEEKAISVHIDGKNHAKVNLSEFEASVEKQDIKLDIIDEADKNTEEQQEVKDKTDNSTDGKINNNSTDNSSYDKSKNDNKSTNKDNDTNTNKDNDNKKNEGSMGDTLNSDTKTQAENNGKSTSNQSSKKNSSKKSSGKNTDNKKK